MLFRVLKGKIFKKKSNFIFYGLLVGLFFLPFLWSSNNHYNLGGDDTRLYLYSPWDWLKNVSLYSWFSISGVSQYNPQQFTFPFVLLLCFINKTLFFLNLQKVILGLTLSLGFLSIYLVVQELLMDKKNINSFLAAIIGGLLYALFPLIFYMDWVQPLYNIYAIFVFPLVIWFFLKAVNNKDIRYLLYGSILNAVFSLVFINVPWFYPFLLGLFIFLILYWLLLEINNKRFIGYFFLYCFFSLLLNLFCIIPMFFSLCSGGFAAEAVVGDGVKQVALNIIHAVSPSMNILDSLSGLLSRKLIFDWNWPQKLAATHTFAYSFFSVYIPCLMFLPLVLKIDKRRRELKLLIGLGFITLILAYLQTVNIGKIGIYIFDWLTQTIPGWVVLRNFYSKVPIAYGIFYAITLSIAIYLLLQYDFSKIVKKVMLSILIIIIVIQAVPFLKGDINNLPVLNPQIEFNRNIIIPDYYHQAMYRLNMSRLGRVLTLPLTHASWSVLNGANSDGIYVGSSPVKVFTGKDDFNGKFSFQNMPKLEELLQKAVKDKQYSLIGKIFGILNVHHIIFNRNNYRISQNFKRTVLWNWDSFMSRAKTEEVIKNISGNKLMDVQGISIYSLADKFIYPLIYAEPKADFIISKEFLPGMSVHKFFEERCSLFIEWQHNNLIEREDKSTNSLVLIDTEIDNFIYYSNSSKVIRLNIIDDGNFEFVLETAGMIELYFDAVKVEDRNQPLENRNWVIEIDSELIDNSLCIDDMRKKLRYVKIGAMELDEGKHEIKVHSSSILADNQNKGIKIVLVDKAEREKVGDEIRQKIDQRMFEVYYIFEEGKGEFYLP